MRVSLETDGPVATETEGVEARFARTKLAEKVQLAGPRVDSKEIVSNGSGLKMKSLGLLKLLASEADLEVGSPRGAVDNDRC